jgi:hypothetical protein
LSAAASPVSPPGTCSSRPAARWRWSRRATSRRVTGHTTAKVSVQHGLIYAELRDRFDPETAAGYGASQLATLDWLRTEIGWLGVDCRWADRDSFVYAEDSSQRDRLNREAEAAAECGLPSKVWVLATGGVPVPLSGSAGLDGPAA